MDGSKGQQALRFNAIHTQSLLIYTAASSTSRFPIYPERKDFQCRITGIVNTSATRSDALIAALEQHAGCSVVAALRPEPLSSSTCSSLVEEEQTEQPIQNAFIATLFPFSTSAIALPTIRECRNLASRLGQKEAYSSPRHPRPFCTLVA